MGRLQIVAQQQQTPVQRDLVRQLLPQAEECWWSAGHVGWTLFDADAMAPTAVQVRVHLHVRGPTACRAHAVQSMAFAEGLLPQSGMEAPT